jgi:hypothetical protein
VFAESELTPISRTVIDMHARHLAVALFASVALTACSNDGRSRGKVSKASDVEANQSAAGSVDLGGSLYRPGPLSAVGSVAGIIKLDGAAPPDPPPITIDQAVCGTSQENPVTVAPKTGTLSNAVVWIAGVSTGKPLPPDKRAELSTEKCILDPRVQGVVVGSTVNVFNDDRLLHKLVFTPIGSRDTLIVMPFFNTGQVVATDRLTKHASIVEVRCVQHPWMRGYLAVFDHPYFAVTDNDGSFKIDSLAPGSYRMMVWHEGMAKPIERQVQIAANGTAKVDLAVRVQ